MASIEVAAKLAEEIATYRRAAEFELQKVPTHADAPRHAARAFVYRRLAEIRVQEVDQHIQFLVHRIIDDLHELKSGISAAGAKAHADDIVDLLNILESLTCARQGRSGRVSGFQVGENSINLIFQEDP